MLFTRVKWLSISKPENPDFNIAIRLQILGWNFLAFFSLHVEIGFTDKNTEQLMSVSLYKTHCIISFVDYLTLGEIGQVALKSSREKLMNADLFSLARSYPGEIQVF